MRVLFLVVLILAGCASPVNSSVSKGRDNSNPEKNYQAAANHFKKCFEASKDPACAYNAGVAAQNMGDMNAARSWYTLAARYGHADAISALTRIGEPVPAADLLQQPQQSQQAPQPQQQKNDWIDVSGKKRNDSILFQDSAACQMAYQQALTTAWQMYPVPPSSGNCPTCGTLNAKAIILRQQNISNYANSAYTNCMETKGWRKQE